MTHASVPAPPLAPALSPQPEPVGPGPPSFGPNSGSQLLFLGPISPRWNLGHRKRNLRGIAIRAESSSETESMIPPYKYNVLITGIGDALAKDFLKAGDNVVICSRSAERVESAVRGLREEFEEQRVGQHAMLEEERM